MFPWGYFHITIIDLISASIYSFESSISVQESQTSYSIIISQNYSCIIPWPFDYTSLVFHCHLWRPWGSEDTRVGDTDIRGPHPSKHRCVLVAQSCPTLRPPWTRAHVAPLSMEFWRQEYWSGLPFASPPNRRSGCFTASFEASFIALYLVTFLAFLICTNSQVTMSLVDQIWKRFWYICMPTPYWLMLFMLKALPHCLLKIFCDYICHFIKCISKLF